VLRHLHAHPLHAAPTLPSAFSPFWPHGTVGRNGPHGWAAELRLQVSGDVDEALAQCYSRGKDVVVPTWCAQQPAASAQAYPVLGNELPRCARVSRRTGLRLRLRLVWA
jgi:hypothetical protein